MVLAGPKPKPAIIPTGVDRQQQMEAFIPTQPVAPANIRQAGQLARATALGIPRAGAGAVESFVRAPLGRQELDERQKKCDQGGVLPADLPIVWLPRGQRREGGPQVALRVAVKAALAANALPLREQSQGHHLTPAEGSLGARVWFRGQRERAKVIDPIM